MKITNETRWRTDQLRAFLTRVAADELDVEQRKVLRVKFYYHRGTRRGDGCSGWAVIKGRSMRVGLPGPDRQMDRVDLAHTLAHEMAHIRGLRHRQMRGMRRYMYVDLWRDYYAWAETLPMALKPVKPGPTRLEKVNDKLIHAMAQERRWKAKSKLASNKLRRWRGRVRALLRAQAIAAMASPPPGCQMHLRQGEAPCTTTPSATE